MRKLALDPERLQRAGIAAVAMALAAGLLGGCSTRIGAQDEQARVPSAPMSGEPARSPRAAGQTRDAPPDTARQGVGAGPVWMDDPARRRGPQGQPAPYGRDTITGRPLSDLPPAGTALADPRRTATGPTSTAPGAGNTIIVGKGDTLYALARRHNVSVDALVRANNLTADNKIRAGQTLIIPGR